MEELNVLKTNATTLERYGSEFTELYKLMKEFFNLPLHIKQNYKDILSPSTDSNSFQICDVGYNQSGGRETYQIRSGNAGVPWPDAAAPELIGFREACLDAFARLQEICLAMLISSLTSTNATIADKILNAISEDNVTKGVSSSVLRLAVYNEVDPNIKPLYEVAHTDSGVVTICVLPETGLEASEGESEGPWIPCNEEEKDCVVVFPGSALTYLSTGAFPATHHRVRNTGKKRYSLVFFLRAKPEVVGPRTEADFQIMLLREKLSHIPETVTNQLHTEVLSNIMRSLDILTVVHSISLVCKKWLKIAQDNCIWNMFYSVQASKNSLACFESSDIDWRKKFIVDFGKTRMTSSLHAKEISKHGIKAVFVGDAGVGKTSLITAACTGAFANGYIPTGFDNFSLSLVIDHVLHTISCWDTAGQQDYDALRPLSYPQTDIFVVLFDSTLRSSFESVTQKWNREIRHHCPATPVVLCATKIDLKTKAPHEVSSEEGVRLADEISALGYYETSALTGMGVRGTIEQITTLVLRRNQTNKKTKGNCNVS